MIMAYYDGGWAPYVPVAERRRRAVLRRWRSWPRRGIRCSPVVIEGRAIATTFWGKAWCDNLESYQRFRKPPAARDAPMCATAR